MSFKMNTCATGCCQEAGQPDFQRLGDHFSGFADGQAESHKWHDFDLIPKGLFAAKGNAQKPKASPGVDGDYVYNGYRFPGWQQ